MDQSIEQATEKTMLDELTRNERLFDHPVYGPVKLQRPNARRERLIAEIRRKQYHADLQDKSILSKTELEKEAIRRGMWSPERKALMDGLMARAGELMTLLDLTGYEGVDQMLNDYQAVVNDLVNLFDGHEQAAEVVGAIVRYYNLDADPEAEDREIIRTNAPSTEVDDKMDRAKVLRTQIEMMHELGKVRKEHQEIMHDYIRLTKDSIESRMDRVESLANIYHCATKPDGQPLWETFESMWDDDPYDVALVEEELYFFNYGYTSEFKKMLGKHGFMLRVPDTSDTSESSPGHPKSSFSGELPESEPSTSSSSSE